MVRSKKNRNVAPYSMKGFPKHATTSPLYNDNTKKGGKTGSAIEKEKQYADIIKKKEEYDKLNWMQKLLKSDPMVSGGTLPSAGGGPKAPIKVIGKIGDWISKGDILARIKNIKKGSN